MKLNETQIYHLAIQAKREPFKDGYLYKKSGKKNTLPDHTTVRWQKRWCVIYCNILFYFDNKENLKPQGVIFLENVYSAQIPAADKSLYCFNIGLPSNDQRQYLFASNSEVECESWVKCILKSSFTHINNKNDELQNELTRLISDREALRHEVSDQWSQISILKSQLRSLRNQFENKSKDIYSKQASITEVNRGEVTTLGVSIETFSRGYSEEEVKNIIKIQAYWKLRLVRKRWQQTVQTYISAFTVEKLKKRNKFLWQFITEEEDFVVQMSTLVKNFLQPMKSLIFADDSCVNKEEITKIFVNSETILVLHQIFIKGMESRMKSWPAVQIDDLLFAVKTAVPIYIQYIKNHPTSLQVLAECKKREKFVKLLKFYEAKEECHGQTLEQFLYYPIRIIPNYINNIHNLLGVTPFDHMEKDSLEVILQKLQEAQCFNHYLDEGESLRHTLEIERLIHGGCHELLTPNQKFVRHGVLKQLSLDTRFPSGKREKIRHCFLFSNHLIIGSRTADGRIRLSKQSGIIPLRATTMKEELEASSLFNYNDRTRSLTFNLNVNISNGPTVEELSVLLMAAKANEKALWTSDISQCVFNLLLEDPTSGETGEVNDYLSKHEVFPEEEGCENSVVKILEKPFLSFASPLKDDSRLRDNADDILYSEEKAGPYQLPSINYASIARLIERLADPRLPGAEFMETFLLTYKAFTTSYKVMEGLVDIYWKVMGGRPSPLAKDEVKERRRTYGNSLSAKSSRVRCNSSFSSTDDLETSFSSTAFPHTSSTVFNYNTLKEQLNSPTKTKESTTTKWCEETNNNNNQSNGFLGTHKLRSASACCAISDDSAVKHKSNFLSKSVEVLWDDATEDSIVRDYVSQCRSCDDLDCNYDNSAQPDIIRVSRERVPFVNHTFTTNRPSLNRRSDSDLQFHVEIRNASDVFDDSPLLSTSYQSTVVNQETDSTPNKHANGDIQNHCEPYEEGPSLAISNSIHEEDISCANMCDDDAMLQHDFTRDNLIDQLNNAMDDYQSSETSTTDQRSVDISLNSTSTSMNSISASNTTTDSGFTSRCDDSKDIPRNNTFDSTTNNSTIVTHSHSDEIICKKRSASENAIRTGSLEYKKSFMSPYFRRQKKEKKERPEKIRLSSDLSKAADLPILLNVKDRSSNPCLHRSQSEHDGVVKETVNKVSSVPLFTESTTTPKKKTVTPRKRSLFAGAFPFRLNPLKRTSSEQLLSINDMLSKAPADVSCSTSNLSEKKDIVALNGDNITNKDDGQLEVGSLCTEKAIIMEETPMESFLAIKKKTEKGLLRRKKSKAVTPSNSAVSSTEEFKEQHPNHREASETEQVRPAVLPKKSVSINRGPLKIMSIFKHWLAKHPKDFVADPELLRSMEIFFKEIREDPRSLPVVKEIVSSVERTIDAHRKSFNVIHPIDVLLLQQQALRSVADDITELEETFQAQPLHNFPFKVVAENMTILEHYIYAKISFHEFISCQWTKKDKNERAPGIMKFISRFNKVTNIISYSVVHGDTPQYRGSVIEFWIRVAAHCRDLNNFNSIMEIISALNASSVHRLKKSWELVSRPMRHIFADLESLITAERSFKNLREAVHMCNPPCVPYLGCYLSDILFVHDGGQTFDANGLINFTKMCRISRLVREIKCYQQLPYTLELNKEVAYSLVNFDIEVNGDMLYDESLIKEPRDSSL